MKAKLTSISALLLVMLLVSSCFKSKEKITPISETQTVAEQLAQRDLEEQTSSNQLRKNNGIVLTAGAAEGDEGKKDSNTSASISASSGNKKTTTLHLKYYMKDIAFDSIDSPLSLLSFCDLIVFA